MEAMQLNTPEAMREIQQKITQKYMDDNMDEIISRYMNEYMNEMLDSMPTEDDIEVHGDVQEDFMKKFAAHMEEEEADVHSDEHLSEVEKFAKRYNIKDQMIQVFIESNFDEFRAIFVTLESMTYNRQSIEEHVITKYPLRTSLFLFNYLYDKEYHAQLRQEFATHVIEGQSELIMEIVMKRQLEFMWDDEKQTEENEIYQEIFDEWFFNRLKKTADQVSEQDVEEGLNQFLRNYEISIDSLVATLLEYPDARTRQRVYANFYNDPSTLDSLKWDFLNSFLDYLEKEELENAYDWMELFFTYDSKHPLVERQKIKQEEFWLEKLNKIQNTPEEEFHYSSDCEKPFSSLLQKKFIGAMLSRWIVEMSLEFLDKQQRRIKVNSSQQVKGRSAKDWLNKVRQLVPITRYENGSQKRLEKLLMERCDDGTYKFEMADALSYLDNNADQFIEWLIELTPLQSWDWVQPKGIDRSIEYIDSLDLESKEAVVSSLLENTDKKDEWISTIIKKLFMPFVAKMTDRNSDSWYKLVTDPLGEDLASEKLMEMLAESASAPKMKEEPETVLDIDPEETPLLHAYLDYLSPTELAGMANFMSKIESNMGMNTRSILKLAEKVVFSFTEFFEGELDAMEEEILSYAQQLILQKFDFLTADLVQQEFDQPENIKAVREELEEGYKKEYAYDFFKVGLQSLVFRKKDANMEQQENQFRMFCRRRISDIIDQKAIEIKKDNLN
ncbi:MAG: hypothetical protein VX619_05190 [bacterium]|nr:hypothetical protein [bacterium]